MSSSTDSLVQDIQAAVWQWAARRRPADAYQAAAALEHDDPNGCHWKAATLCAHLPPLAGARVLSLGASAAFYELALVERERAAHRTMASMHLVDTDAPALARGTRALRRSGVPDVLAHALPAERAPLAPAYDLTLFLSLFHHYDRLGGIFRDAGLQLLRTVMSRSRLLVFDTGQQDDRQVNADEWRHALLMGRADALGWLTVTLPSMLGIRGVRHLGTNPRTGRHLMLYWQDGAEPRWDERRRAPAPAAG